MATIEAIYYLYREYAVAYELKGQEYDGRYDNLLFYFMFFYNMIQNKYRKEKKKYTHRQREGYIEYEDDKAEDCWKWEAQIHPSELLEEVHISTSNVIYFVLSILI